MRGIRQCHFQRPWPWFDGGVWDDADKGIHRYSHGIS